MPRAIFVVAAAGSGQRLGAAVPKQYLELRPGRSVLDCCLDRLFASAVAEELIIALAPEDRYFAHSAYYQDQRVHPVVGGGTRAQSVANAVDYACQRFGADCWLLIHDAARPLVTELDLQLLWRQALEHDCACALACAVNDSVYRLDSSGVLQPPVLSGLWRTLTPQAARAQQLQAALRRSGTDAAVRDEVGALLAAGLPVRLVPGSASNLKITTEADLNWARALVDIAHV